MTTAFRHFLVDCITHSEAALDLVAETFGRDHVLFGSDWPFSMGLTEPHAQLARVAPALRGQIMAADPERQPADLSVP